VLSYDPQADGVAFTLDLTYAYSETAGVESFVRAFAWSVDLLSRSAMLRLVDTFRFTTPSAVIEECFISLRLPTLGAGTVTWSGERGTISMQFDRDQFEPIATQAHLGDPFTVYRLRLRALRKSVDREDVFVFVCR
jgi:hypothetical protein